MDSLKKEMSEMEKVAFPSSSTEDLKLNPETMNSNISNAFESLGLVVNNGKPRFKLDEPVTNLSASTMMTSVNVDNENDDTLSFVILSKDSVNAIQASSLASYVDIQQKSMSVDYNSIISSLNANEVQQKLTELLQENIKLKETLKQNNIAMKQQFNILATWQEEVMKIHQDHKEKFTETRQLINYLKKENAELKVRLSTQQAETTEHDFEAIKAVSISDGNGIFINEAKLQEQISLLTEELNNSKLECKELREVVEWHRKMYEECFKDVQTVQLEKEAEKEKLSICTTNLSCNSTQTSLKYMEDEGSCKNCRTKDEKIVYIQKVIHPLMEGSLCNLTLTELPNLSKSSITEREKFVHSMQKYNIIMQELVKYFNTQGQRFAFIEDYFREIKNILESVERYIDAKTETERDSLIKTSLEEYIEKLNNYYEKFVYLQVENIAEKQTLIRSQNEFQKIFSDYHSILHELEIKIDENAKLNILNDNYVRKNLQKQMEQCTKIKEEKQSLDEEKKTFDQKKNDFKEEKKIFDQEKNGLEEQKKLFENQKKNLDKECKLLLEEKKLLQQERTNLSEERSSLDHQSQLYEDQVKLLQNQMKCMQSHNEQLQSEINSLQQNIRDNSTELRELQQQFTQNTETIHLLRTQLTLYEEDFKQEKELKQSLLEEKDKLETELQKQVDFNKQLLMRDTWSVQNQSMRSSQTSGNIPARVLICPKCDLICSSVGHLSEHIEKCLEEVGGIID